MGNTAAVEDSRIEVILKTIRSLNQLKDMDMILDRILEESRNMTKADAGSIYLLKDKNLHFSHVHNDTLFGKQGAGAAQYANIILPLDNSTIVGHSALTRKPVVVDDAYNIPADAPYSFSASFDEGNDYHTTSILALPLITSMDELVGVIQLINAQDQHGNTTVFPEHSKTMTLIFANYAAITIEHGILNRGTILRMIKMASLHDPKETGAHVQRVGAFSGEIFQHWAKKKGMADKEIMRFRDLLSLAAMTHDAGKVGISDVILKKPARLTEEEFNIIKNHTIYGAQLFDNTTTELDKMTYEVALHHHQKWNGKGYPDETVSDGNATHKTLAGEQIPLAARIVALADVFDALSSSRCYKEAWDKEKVYGIIRSERGIHFDPELVDTFFEITDILCAIQKKFQ